jgi:hypothetical protein
MLSYKLTLTLPPLQHAVHNRILCQVVSAKVDQKVSSPVKGELEGEEKEY